MTDSLHGAWNSFVDGLRAAGDQLADDIGDCSPTEQADAFRALLRGLANQLGRVEVDRERPELVPFNGWRQKMFMDNPDFAYWVADVRDDRRYRIRGALGDAVYISVTAYAPAGANPRSDGPEPATVEPTASISRLDSDSMTLGDHGAFELIISSDDPGELTGDWLRLPRGASTIWVRQFLHDARGERPGWCEIEPLDDPAPSAPIEPARLGRQLGRLGRTTAAFPAVWAASTESDRATPNQVRHWAEMAGGAAFTEPGIHYLRGSWFLAEGEALVIEGAAPRCRYWNVLLYSPVLNSLDHRSRQVSFTDGTAQLVDGHYPFVISPEDPATGDDWLDTEGRPFGLFVFRFLQPDSEPELPTVRVRRLADLDDEASRSDGADGAGTGAG